MGRVALWAVAFVVVVTAGCGSLAGDDRGVTARSSTVTPVPIETPRPTAVPSTVAPGLATDRIVDYTALVEHHARVINGTSHTYRRRVTRRYANGTVWRTYSTVVERNGSALRYRYNWTTAASDGSGQVIDRWSTGGRTYVARTDPGWRRPRRRHTLPHRPEHRRRGDRRPPRPRAETPHRPRGTHPRPSVGR